MIKRKSIIAIISTIALLATTVICSNPVNASAWSKAPSNKNNPIITITFTRADANDYNAPFDQMKPKCKKGKIDGKVRVNGLEYWLNDTYLLDIDKVHFNSNGVIAGRFTALPSHTTYSFNVIGEETPSPVMVDGEKKLEGKYVFTYELIEQKIPKPKMKSVVAGKKCFTANWEPLPKENLAKKGIYVDYTQLQYSTSSKFSNAKTLKFNKRESSKKISNLTKGKTYYVRVRYQYNFKNGPWSAVKKVKVK